MGAFTDTDVQPRHVREVITANAGDDEGLSMLSYSGRGMFGSTCLGVEYDRDAVSNSYLPGPIAIMFGAWALAWVEEDVERPDTEDMIGALSEIEALMRSDNMGFGRVYYWPGFEVDPRDGAFDEG